MAGDNTMTAVEVIGAAKAIYILIGLGLTFILACCDCITGGECSRNTGNKDCIPV